MQIRRLDTLRGLAVLIVMVSHFGNHAPDVGDYTRGSGQLGVMLFFLLSGFLMAHLYWRREPTGAGLRQFFIRRGARVVPLYYVVVLLSFATPWLYDVSGVGALASHLLFLEGRSVLWTIPPEIHFYLLFGLTWLISRDARPWIAIPVAVACVGPFLIGSPDLSFDVLGLHAELSLVRVLPYFVTGGVMGFLYGSAAPRRFARGGWVFVAAALVLLLYPGVFRLLFGFGHGMWRNPAVLVSMAAAFGLVVFCVPEGTRILESRLGDFYGRISYSLYLLHKPVLVLLVGLDLPLPTAVLFVLFLTAATLISWASYALVERPLRRAIRAWGDA